MVGERISPNQESSLLIKTKDDAERQRIYNTANDLAVKRIFNPIDQADARRVNERARGVVRSTTGSETVQELRNISQDDSKPDEQKAKAEENIDHLGKAVFLVMYYGGNEELAERVVAGSTSVEEVLPDALKGLGDVVTGQLFKSQEVKSVLDQLDDVKNRVDFNNPRHLNYFREELKNAEKELVFLKVPREYQSESIMATQYVATLINRYGLAEERPAQTNNQTEQRNQNTETNEALAGALNNLADRLPEKLSEEEKQNAMYRQMYDFYWGFLALGNLQNIDPLGSLAPEWMQKDPDKTLLQKQIQLGNAAYYKNTLGDTNLQALFDTEAAGRTFSATNEIMKRLYENVPGVRECLEDFMSDFFEGYFENVDKEKIFKLRMRGTKDEVKAKFSDIRDIQLKMRDKLIGPDGLFNSGNELQDRMEAIRAVSIAWNLMYVGNVLEDADTDKWIEGEAVAGQVWNLMHPARKAWDKIVKKKDDAGREEAFGGQKGQYLVRQIERTRAGYGDARSLSKNYVVDPNDYTKSRIHPYPERLFTSFFINTKYHTTDVAKRNRNGSVEYAEMTLAQAILEKKTINFSEEAASSNEWGGYYDFANNARTLYDFTTGKKTLVLEVKQQAPSKEMMDWANELADVRSKVGKNKYVAKYVNSPEFLLWSIAASVRGGLYPDSGHLIMMTPTVGTQAQYYELNTLFGIRDLVRNEKEKRYVMNALTCGSPESVGARNIYTGKNLLSILYRFFSYLGF
jgi:hypothetical protein